MPPVSQPLLKWPRRDVLSRLRKRRARQCREAHLTTDKKLGPAGWSLPPAQLRGRVRVDGPLIVWLVLHGPLFPLSAQLNERLPQGHEDQLQRLRSGVTRAVE